MSETIHDVIIIGAGPAGLCTAYELQRRGIKATLLEAGSHPGWSWSNMAENITVLSPWKRNVMNGSRWSVFNMHRQPPVREYQLYLETYAEQNALDVICDCSVERVDRDDDGRFSLTTSNGPMKAKRVVNATGYFFNPKLPRFEGHDAQLPMIHSQQFKSVAKLVKDFPDIKRLLVIGGRVSAGQTATELALSKRFDVDLCLRHPLRFSRDPWLQKLAFWIFYLVEDHWAKTKPQMLEDTNPPMEGGVTRRLIEKGEIKKRPCIAKIDGKTVHFDDGQTADYDLLLACTGYDVVSKHLEPLQSAHDSPIMPTDGQFASPTVPGLYFIGVDKIRTFRSRYLRGIREDSIFLANQFMADVSQ
ncbi:MAG: FAD-dependent oxidoreductase [Pseudomonadota bacterium]